MKTLLRHPAVLLSATLLVLTPFSAVAAKRLITGSDIKNNSISLKDLNADAAGVTTLSLAAVNEETLPQAGRVSQHRAPLRGKLGAGHYLITAVTHPQSETGQDFTCAVVGVDAQTPDAVILEAVRHEDFKTAVPLSGSITVSPGQQRSSSTGLHLRRTPEQAVLVCPAAAADTRMPAVEITYTQVKKITYIDNY